MVNSTLILADTSKSNDVSFLDAENGIKAVRTKGIRESKILKAHSEDAIVAIGGLPETMTLEQAQGHLKKMVTHIRAETVSVEDAGATVVAAIALPSGDVAFANIGDSCIFAAREGKMVRLNEPQETLLNGRVYVTNGVGGAFDRGHYGVPDAFVPKSWEEITQDLGGTDNIKLIVASDGLTEYKRTLRERFNALDMESAENLANKALKNGSTDDISIIMIDMPPKTPVFATVSDGVGGLEKGEVASTTAVNAAKAYMQAALHLNLDTVIPESFEKQLPEKEFPKLKWEDMGGMLLLNSSDKSLLAELARDLQQKFPEDNIQAGDALVVMGGNINQFQAATDTFVEQKNPSRSQGR